LFVCGRVLVFLVVGVSVVGCVGFWCFFGGVCLFVGAGGGGGGGGEGGGGGCVCACVCMCVCVCNRLFVCVTRPMHWL